jgi:formylglycine-generating enzyme required for sulfatase activity/class 3 adenylate cyclase/glycosyltransferase involved in cell wall biosynthesis
MLASVTQNDEQAMDVIFLATAWGPRYGGINAFNIDICIALAGLVGGEQDCSLRVACIVPSASWGSVEARLCDGVLVIPLGHPPERTELPAFHAAEVVAQLNQHDLAGSVIVGHDLHTGPLAMAVRDALRARSSTSCRAAIVLHTDPAAYKGFEGGSAERAQAKVDEQHEIIRHADLVFAVGPRLVDAARDLLRRSKIQPVELIPGLAPIVPIAAPPRRFHAITFGRLDPRADRIKQGRLALASFAEAFGSQAGDLGRDPVFRLVGVEREEADEFAVLAAERARRPINVYALPFDDDRGRLWERLAEHSASLMLSLHEGFGLTGWEAISAGVPLVLSTNTGLYDHLEKHNALGRKALGCVYPVTVLGSLDTGDFNPRDIEVIGAALADVAREPAKAKKSALDLRQMCISAGFTWTSTANEFAKACGLKLMRRDTMASSRGPTATTYLMCDVVGRTDMLARLGDDPGVALLERFYEIARTMLPAHGGRQIDRTDGFCLHFERPLMAVRYAEELHERLVKLSVEVGVQLEVRVGVHYDEIRLRGDAPDKSLDAQGLATAVTARVMSLAVGNQTLMSEPAVTLARGAWRGEPDESSWLWIDHGEHELKGLRVPLHVWEVSHRQRTPKIDPKHRSDHNSLSLAEFHIYRTAALARHEVNHFFGFPGKVPVGSVWEDFYIDLTVDEDHGHTKDQRFESERMHPRTVKLDDAFVHAANCHTRAMILLGQPGSGKTTQLRQMLLQGLDEARGPTSLGLPVKTLPVFVALRELQLPDPIEPSRPLDLEVLIQQALIDNGVSETLTQRVMASPNLLLLLDGLDEIANRDARKAVAEAIQRAQSGRLARHHMLVSSRYAGYVNEVRLGPAFLELRLCKLDDPQVERLVHKWHEAVEEAEARQKHRAPSQQHARERAEALLGSLQSLETAEEPRLDEMARTPLLLTALCLIHKRRPEGGLSLDREAIYEECAEILLERWRDEAKRLPVTLRADLAKRALQPVAGWLHGELERRYAGATQLHEPITRGLAAIGHAHVVAREFLGSFTNESGLLTQWGPELYGFIHLGFQEHLTARHVLDQWPTNPAEIDKLAQQFGEEWWREVILLTLIRAERALFDRFIAQIVQQPEFPTWSTTRLMQQCLLGLGASPGPFVELLHARGTGVDVDGLNDRQLAAVKLLARQFPDALGGIEALLVNHDNPAVRAWWANRRVRSGRRLGKAIRFEEAGIDLMRIEGGTFLMGSPDDDEEAFGDERPQHEVELGSFYLARTPVTNAQYSRYLAQRPDAPEPALWGNKQYIQPEQPVVGVSWNEAQTYCDWAGLVLPTEAQWEYACRAGTTTRYWSGDTEQDLARVGWYRGNADRQLHLVGEKEANAFGLLDMHGNVREWCRDNMGAYTTSARPVDGLRHEPVGDTDRVVRGGGWVLAARVARSAYRDGRLPSGRFDFIGFRPALGQP